MADLIRFPKVAPGVEEAMVGCWRVAVGDFVRKGDALVEMITDKATFDLECEGEGTVLRILAPEKTCAPVGYALCALGEQGEEPPDASEENRKLMEAHRARAEELSWSAHPAEASKASGKLRATPSARRLARQEGVDLERVAQMKGRGVVREEDVRRFLETGGG